MSLFHITLREGWPSCAFNIIARIDALTLHNSSLWVHLLVKVGLFRISLRNAIRAFLTVNKRHLIDLWT